MRLFQKGLNLVNIMLIYIKDERLEVARVSCLVTFDGTNGGKNWRLYILRTDLCRRFESQRVL